MNIGLNFLRIILTLGVVMDHFWWMPNPQDLRGVDVALWHLRTLAVPAFMTSRRWSWSIAVAQKAVTSYPSTKPYSLM